jgi:hypothetical protein
MNDFPELLELYLRFVNRTHETGWHWFDYHFYKWPPHPFARSILEACVFLDVKMPGLGTELLMDVASIGGKEKHHPDYDQLMQKLAEILVLSRVAGLQWPQGAKFIHEPEGSPRGKRPELLVEASDGDFLFEVKAPSLLRHQLLRARNGVQLPSRGIPVDVADRLAGSDGVTLPRDNPVKDFLIDANEKFRIFKVARDCTSILVIVWDDFIYEPITALKHEMSGLLTPNSFARNANGDPMTFKHIDAIVLIRHLTYFQNAAGEGDLLDRRHAFDFGDERALPNVYLPMRDGVAVASRIQDGLRALPLGHPFLQMAAEYHPSDLVFWLPAGAGRATAQGK